jgi:hypothetical protein
LNVEGCIRLKTLDADGNFFNDLNFPYLPGLVNLSLLRNNFNQHSSSKKLILRSPNLKFLVIKGSDVEEVVHLYGLSRLGNLNVMDDAEHARIYGTIEASMQA